MKPLTDEMKNYIQYGIEDRSWEFKPPTTWTQGKKKRKFEIVKAIIALSNNNDGGFLIFGISQQRDRSNGVIFERKGLTTRQFNTFDNPDDIGRFINEKTNQPVNFEIYGGTVLLEKKECRFIVLQVFESLRGIPTICTYDFKSKDRRCRLKKGVLYIRSISNPVESRNIRTNEEWDGMVRRLLAQKEELLYKDLRAICHAIKASQKIQKPKLKSRQKKSVEYEKFLRRDNL